MKRILILLLLVSLLAGCGAAPTTEVTEVTPTQGYGELAAPVEDQVPYVSRFDKETLITLSDEGVTSSGPNSLNVFSSDDIVYYEAKEEYESGNPYGEGEAADMHTEAEAKAHTVVNITAPGAYRVSGKLSQGQIRVDLGKNAYEDPQAVVELILEDADITCAVAPAILFLNVYECDGQWSTDTAKADVDTTDAGANLILEGKNAVSGSYVAKIYKDKEGEKKLWKQDGAIYSYMSMNVYGPGQLDLTAQNEGLDTELHLTINGGDIAIRSGNDGINTNEDGVSVTTINGGNLHIIAGLGVEGDGIDSNGYLVINGGTVVSAASPISDAGLDSDLGSFVNGGNVIALGAAMDWAETESGQVTMNLRFASYRSGSEAITVTQEDGTVIFSYDPSQDEILGDNGRRYQGAILSCGNFHQGETYQVWVGGDLTGTETGGMYDATTVTGFSGGVQMAYTGTDAMGFGPGGMGGFGGQRPDGQKPADMELPEGFGGNMPTWSEGQMPSMPEGEKPEGGWGDFGGQFPEGEMPDGDWGNWDGFGGQFPEGEMPSMPTGERPDGGKGNRGDRGEGNRGDRGEGKTPPDFGGEMPEGGFPGGFAGFGNFGGEDGEPSTEFYMKDYVNFFSGLREAE